MEEDNARDTKRYIVSKFAENNHWPAGERKKGAVATDFREKLHNCIKLTRHAPVIGNGDGKCKIFHMNPLPIGTTSSWSTAIGFNSHAHFEDLNVSVEDLYNLKNGQELERN